MAHGGRRPGAGRPKGACTKKALALVQKHEEQARTEPPKPGAGTDPVDAMLENLAWCRKEAVEIIRTILDPNTPEAERKLRLTLFGEEKAIRALAQSIARDVAPYLAPRLSAVVQGDKQQGPRTRNVGTLEQAF